MYRHVLATESNGNDERGDQPDKDEAPPHLPFLPPCCPCRLVGVAKLGRQPRWNACGTQPWQKTTNSRNRALSPRTSQASNDERRRRPTNRGAQLSRRRSRVRVPSLPLPRRAVLLRLRRRALSAAASRGCRCPPNAASIE